MHRCAPSLCLTRCFGVSNLYDRPKKDPLRNAFCSELVAGINEDVGYWLEEQLIIWVTLIETPKRTTVSAWPTFHGPLEP